MGKVYARSAAPVRRTRQPYPPSSASSSRGGSATVAVRVPRTAQPTYPPRSVSAASSSSSAAHSVSSRTPSAAAVPRPVATARVNGWLPGTAMSPIGGGGWVPPAVPSVSRHAFGAGYQRPSSASAPRLGGGSTAAATAGAVAAAGGRPAGGRTDNDGSVRHRTDSAGRFVQGKCFENTGLMNAGVCRGTYDGHEAIVKFVDPKKDGIRDEIATLKRVARICNSAQRSGCRHVVRIFTTVKRSDGMVGIVMDYLNAGDLLKGRARYASIRGKHITEILIGLRFLHQSGLVHCDIKPDNVLLHRQTPSSAPHAVIGDLGLTVRTGTPIRTGFIGYALKTGGTTATEIQDLFALVMLIYDLIRPGVSKRVAGGHPVEAMDAEMRNDVAALMSTAPSIPSVYPAFVPNLMHYFRMVHPGELAPWFRPGGGAPNAAPPQSPPMVMVMPPPPPPMGMAMMMPGGGAPPGPWARMGTLPGRR